MRCAAGQPLLQLSLILLFFVPSPFPFSSDNLLAVLFCAILRWLIDSLASLIRFGPIEFGESPPSDDIIFRFYGKYRSYP